MVETFKEPVSCSDDESFVVSASQGDRAAFGVLYSRYARMVHGILLTRVPYSDAEDLVQDVFVSAMRQLPLLRTPAAFPGWLAAIARNRAVNFHRTSRKFSELQEEAFPMRPNHSAQQEAFAILDIIRKLPEAYRESLVLRLVEGMTGPEIAQRIGLTPDSVRVNLFRGMKLLREQLGGKL